MAKKKKKRPERPLTIDVCEKPTLDYVRELAARGMYEKDIGACLGYTATYFSALKKQHPQLSEALNSGAAHGIERATGWLVDEMESRNTTATIFYLKCKAGWRDNAPATDSADADGNSEALSKRILEGLQKLAGGG